MILPLAMSRPLASTAQVGFADIQSLLSSESLTMPVLGPVVDPVPEREYIRPAALLYNP